MIVKLGDTIQVRGAPAVAGLRFRGFRGEADYVAMSAVINGSKDADGLAGALIARSLRAIKARGMTEAAPGVDMQNQHGALRLYESMGYRPVPRGATYRKRLKTVGVDAQPWIEERAARLREVHGGDAVRASRLHLAQETIDG